MKNKSNWVLFITLGIAGICLLGCFLTLGGVAIMPNIYEYSLKNTSLDIGGTAPDFELPTLTGETVKLSQFRGRPVLLTFGASWCPDCRVEAPLLEEIHQKNSDLVIILVDIKESPEVVQEFVKEFKISHLVLLDSTGEIMDLYEIFAIPTELFIDENGIIQAKIIEKVTPQLLEKNLPLIGISP